MVQVWCQFSDIGAKHLWTFKNWAVTFWLLPFAGILKDSGTGNSGKMVAKVSKGIFVGYV